MDKLFYKTRLRLTLLYTLGIIFVFSVGYGFNLLFDKVLPEYRVDPLLFIVETVLIILTVIASFWLAGRTLRPIADSYQQQKKFIADAAHELRTPLAVMKTGAETLLAGQATKNDYQKLTRDSLEEVDYMSTTVNDLLLLASGDDQQTPVFVKVNFTKLVCKQTELMQPYARKKNVMLSQNCQNELYIQGNEVYLKRLLSNLLQNAIDYNKPRGAVTVSLTKSSHEITLMATDTGIGMASEDLAHMFDRFYKADKARVAQSGGAGLGLAIVKEIVEAHHGAEINVTSKIGEGTTVNIIFPIYS